MRFYSNKMHEVVALEDGFKRKYMLSAFMLMMKDHGSSFDFDEEGMDAMKAGMNQLKSA
jgi:anaerobic magnesium-protoporphyrin IX monomethyl ester cyclase